MTEPDHHDTDLDQPAPDQPDVEPEPDQDAAEDAEADPDNFPREYVEKLRQEAAEARVKAKRADQLARDLFAARVAATGRLADPNDLTFDEALLDDPDALDTALDQLLAEHPHYAARTPRGDIGQGATGTTADLDLAALLRRTA